MIGGVDIIVDLPGVAANQLRLTGEVLADIYLGKITKWGDPKIASLNPGLKLPTRPSRPSIGPMDRARPSCSPTTFDEEL